MHLHLSSYLYPVALGLPLVLSCCHHKQSPTPLDTYIAQVDANATLMKKDPKALPNGSYPITDKLYVPLGSASNQLTQDNDMIIFEGASATVPQMIHISADGTVITPIDPLLPIVSRDRHLLYTRDAIYLTENGQYIKIPRTPALPQD